MVKYKALLLFAVKFIREDMNPNIKKKRRNSPINIC